MIEFIAFDARGTDGSDRSKMVANYSYDGRTVQVPGDVVPKDPFEITVKVRQSILAQDGESLPESTSPLFRSVSKIYDREVKLQWQRAIRPNSP